jgi:hypothetical protein
MWGERMIEYKVGTVIQREGRSWLIHRIVDSKSFFEDTHSKECYVIDELYLELRCADEISFLALREHKETVTKDPAVIEAKLRGPDTLEWRKAGKVKDL